jgi:FAD:protein FMN transferase
MISKSQPSLEQAFLVWIGLRHTCRCSAICRSTSFPWVCEQGLRRALSVASLVVCSWAGCGVLPAWGEERYEFRQIHMGVDVSLTLYASTAAKATEAADRAFARIAKLEQVFSDYSAESEAMVVCRTAALNEPIPVSDDLWTVLRFSRRLSEQSDGAFDVTLGPMTKLWRRARRQKQLPTADDLAAVRSLVGWQRLTIDSECPTVSLSTRGMQWDFGGIAKGYAAQAAIDTLREHGVARALVAVAGDIVAADPPPDRAAWDVSIEGLSNASDNSEPNGQMHPLVNRAISTSGDVFQSVEIAGVRYSHIVDPRTGVGLTVRRSVTVVAPDGMTADSLATALSILDPSEGLKLLQQYPGSAARIVTLNEAGEPETIASDGWLSVSDTLHKSALNN